MTNQDRIAELKAEIAALEQDSFFEDEPAPVAQPVKRRSKGKPWSHYQAMRRTNPHQYYQAATQKELVASRAALGDAFFKE